MRRASVIALLALFAAVSITAAATVTSKPARTTRDTVSEGLTCQCGCGLTVANCNHPNCEFSVPVRDRIDKLIGQGMDRAQIIAIFRAQYGEKVLSAPTTQGFNLLAWLMPPIAMLLGAMLVMFTISRWRSAPADQPASGTPAPPSGGAADSLLRRELERRLREGM